MITLSGENGPLSPKTRASRQARSGETVEHWQRLITVQHFPHDLLASILRAFEAKIERVIINDVKYGFGAFVDRL